jgi:hypothetical protein
VEINAILQFKIRALILLGDVGRVWAAGRVKEGMVYAIRYIFFEGQIARGWCAWARAWAGEPSCGEAPPQRRKAG